MFPTAILLLAVAAPPVATEPATAYQQAEKLSAFERFGEAEPLYLAALKSDDRYLKRETYNRLMNLYMRSGRPDKAVRIGTAFRDWLKGVGDPDGVAELDLLTAQCHLDLVDQPFCVVG